MLRVREAGRQDRDFLAAAVAVAFDWRPDLPVRSARAVLAAKETAKYVVGWPQAGERGLVAESRGSSPVGAAWWRYLPGHDPGYGFLNADVPEVTLGVLNDYRGQGLGTVLMQGLITLAEEESLPGLSLSVEPENFAVRLYERLGFVEMGKNEGSLTMLLTLR